MFLLIFAIILLVIGIIMFITIRNRDLGTVSKFIASALCVVSVIMLVASVFATVPTGHTGIVTTFGKVENITLDSGLHFKSPISKVVNMDNRTQKGTLKMSCFSSDIQEVHVTYTLNYQIQKENAQNIYRTIGKDYYNTVVTPCVQESLKTVTAKYDAEDLIGSRAKLSVEVEEVLSKKLEKYNVILVSSAIEDMDFTDAFTNAVEAKQVAAQNKLKAETEAEQKIIEAQANADAKLISANAEAKANKAISKSLTDDILYQQWLEKWDGKVPQVAGADANVIINGLSENGKTNK